MSLAILTRSGCDLTICDSTFSLVQRDAAVWGPCSVNSTPGTLPRAHTFVEPQTPMNFRDKPATTILTSYDPTKKKNKDFPAPCEADQREEWTRRERTFAKTAPVVENLKDLEDKVRVEIIVPFVLTRTSFKLSNMYHEGVKSSPNQYVRVPMEVLGRCVGWILNEWFSLMSLPAVTMSTSEVRMAAYWLSSRLQSQIISENLCTTFWP